MLASVNAERNRQRRLGRMTHAIVNVVILGVGEGRTSSWTNAMASTASRMSPLTTATESGVLPTAAATRATETAGCAAPVIELAALAQVEATSSPSGVNSRTAQQGQWRAALTVRGGAAGW